jgi:3-oxoacyl-[acyl-carrier protein] reductase
MKIDLAGRTALVTGASRGIGREIAVALAGAGANVACIATNAELLGQLAAQLGEKALAITADVSRPEDIERAVDACAKKFGGLDILVNNAGITRDGLLLRMKEEDWDAVLDVNLKGPFLLMKAALRHIMRSPAGRIINVSSVSGVIGNAGQANYSASKGGLISLTKTAAREFGSRNVTVNAVAPGFIRTDMAAKVDPKVIEGVVASLPLRRIGEAKDVAGAVLFLASDLAAYVTGQVLSVDGGMAM